MISLPGSPFQGRKDKALWCFSKDITPASQRVPGPQGGLTAPDYRHQAVGNSSLFLPSCPASPAKHQTLSWQSRLCFGVSVVSRTFFLPTFPLPSVPLVPGPRFCVSWRPHHSTLFLGSTGVAETSSHDLAGAPLNFVYGHGHLIFI